MEPPVKRMDVNWIAVLVPYEDGKNFEVIGNPFQVKGVLAKWRLPDVPLSSTPRFQTWRQTTCACFTRISPTVELGAEQYVGHIRFCLTLEKRHAEQAWVEAPDFQL